MLLLFHMYFPAVAEFPEGVTSLLRINSQK